MKRFFVTQQLGQDLVLSGSEHHHLANVVRCKVGERITLVNGDQNDYRYEIRKITKHDADLVFVDYAKNRSNPTRNLTVYVGLIKLENLALIIPQLNQVGVSHVVPFLCARSNMDKRAVDTEKLQAIANQSSKQCGRSIPLSVGRVVTFKEMLGTIKLFGRVFYADRGERSVRITTDSLVDVATAALVIGPEGGLDLNENLALTDVATAITLGRRTLRSETAAVVGATLILTAMGEL